MKLGLIGNPLGHSWSPDIHRYFLGEDLQYSKWELEEDELKEFFDKRDFDGINVTIPYKTEAIKYLDEIDDTVARVQAVNCIVNDNGVLKGFNTDVAGLEKMAGLHDINKECGQVAILGSGGAGKAAQEVCRRMGWNYYIVSRTKRDGFIDYDELYERADEIVLLINTTPVGLSPDIDGMPADLDRLGSLKYVMDVIANPVRSRLVLEARERGLTALGGLEMLVAQGMAADRLFTGKDIDDSLMGGCIGSLCEDKLNIVLIGMPSAGKTTIAACLSEALGREYCEMDEEIVKQIGMPIADYFKEHGEAAFRDLESALCKKLAGATGMIISTGGGVVKRAENMRYLAHNGRIVWIDRDPDKLTATDSRPLSQSQSDMIRLYEERKNLYEKYSDVRIKNNESIQIALNELIESLGSDENLTSSL